MDFENPYEPPVVAEVSAPVLPDTPMVLASLGERFLGSLIDGLICVAFVLLCALALHAIGFTKSFEDFANLGVIASFSLTLVVYLFQIGINWKFLSSSGQTIGKKVMKIRVVTLDGRLPSMFDQVVKRYGFFNLVTEIPVVGMPVSFINILFIFGRERRCLHDYIAGTRVVKALPTA